MTEALNNLHGGSEDHFALATEIRDFVDWVSGLALLLSATSPIVSDVPEHERREVMDKVNEAYETIFQRTSDYLRDYEFSTIGNCYALASLLHENLRKFMAPEAKGDLPGHVVHLVSEFIQRMNNELQVGLRHLEKGPYELVPDEEYARVLQAAFGLAKLERELPELPRLASFLDESKVDIEKGLACLAAQLAEAVRARDLLGVYQHLPMELHLRKFMHFFSCEAKEHGEDNLPLRVEDVRLTVQSVDQFIGDLVAEAAAELRDLSELPTASVYQKVELCEMLCMNLVAVGAGGTLCEAAAHLLEDLDSAVDKSQRALLSHIAELATRIEDLGDSSRVESSITSLFSITREARARLDGCPLLVDQVVPAPFAPHAPVD
jgi:hypothetical protein